MLTRARTAGVLAVVAAAVVVPLTTAAPAHADPACDTQYNTLVQARQSVADATVARNEYRTDTVVPAQDAVVSAGTNRGAALTTFLEKREVRRQALADYRADPTSANRQKFNDARDDQGQAADDYGTAKQAFTDATAALTTARSGQVPFDTARTDAIDARAAAKQAYDACVAGTPQLQVTGVIYSEFWDGPGGVVHISGLTPGRLYVIDPTTFCADPAFSNPAACPSPPLTANGEGVVDTTYQYGAPSPGGYAGFPVVSCSAPAPTGQMRVYDYGDLQADPTTPPVLDTQVPVDLSLCG